MRKITPERVFTADDIRKEDPRFSVENRQAVQRFSESIGDILMTRKISLSELVIAWTLRQPQIDFVLCGARNPDQARHNAHAGEVDLSDDDIMRVEAAISEYLVICL